MPGMHCDFCQQLLPYGQNIVALREAGNGIEAAFTIEKEGGSIEEGFQPVGKYHVRCYERMRRERPEEWPELPA